MMRVMEEEGADGMTANGHGPYVAPRATPLATHAEAVRAFVRAAVAGGADATDVVADERVEGQFGVRDGDRTAGWVVYIRTTPWRLQEVEFYEWPPSQDALQHAAMGHACGGVIVGSRRAQGRLLR